MISGKYKLFLYFLILGFRINPLAKLKINASYSNEQACYSLSKRHYSPPIPSNKSRFPFPLQVSLCLLAVCPPFKLNVLVQAVSLKDPPLQRTQEIKRNSLNILER